MKSGSDFSHVTFISAGAGSGKTYRLTEELERALVDGHIDPAGVIGTTFTVKAAGELKDRVRERLIGSGRPQMAEQMSQALIGTVHSVCERLLKRFAFELGISPQQNVLGIEDHRLFHQALDEILSLDDVRTMNGLALRLGIATWQDDVKRVADRARENAVGPAALAAMGTTSADALLEFFPAPQAGDHRNVLLRALTDAAAAIDLASDTTKGTAKYVEYLRAANYQLRRADCPWSVWIKLGAEKATKASDAVAARVRDAAQRYAINRNFHDDIRAYIERTYGIAAATLERFGDIKTQRGLIDFTDMEQRMLDALESPAVQERLDDELQLLLVDEFQDTNPMQLALFVKLARFADRVIFVGDVKQAIYAFRGCDPDLVFRTLDGLTTHDASTDLLEWSWRSRPALVEYVNAVFVAAFAKDGIAAEQIRLAAQRPERITEPVITLWLSVGNKMQQFAAVAHAVAGLVADGVRVVDPATGQPRAVRYGDIAILARTNANVEAQALALKAARVPMKMTLRGLLEVPEVCLARACLRRLIDATDTLATAEIVVLADSALPDVWLGERLRVVAEGAGQQQWLEADHPIVKRLAELRADAAFQAPVETVVRVLNDIGIREIAAAWGPDAIKAAQRQRNLDAFLNLAVEYETYCTTVHEAATLTGFLFWVLDPHSPDLDLQPTVTTGDAVHVLTYHKAKGLEWPIVITTDFDAENRSSLWDARVLLTGAFDVNAPLANRVIRFWPRLFGERRKGIAILEAIETSAEALDCERKNASEQRRLAYVGITRARDLLIVALTDKLAKGGAWLGTFATGDVLPTGNALQLPNGVVVPSHAALIASDGAPPAPLPYAPAWFVARERVHGAARPLRELLSPSQAEAVVDATVCGNVELGARVSIDGADMTLIGNALHAVIAAELVNPDRIDAVARASAILAGYAAAELVDAADAIMCARRFRAFVMAHFNPSRVHVEYPITHVLPNGQRVRGWIDVLLQTADGMVVIDHKSSPRPRSEWQQEALSHSGQLQGYRRALIAAGERVSACAIHFPISGGLVFVEGL
jgi:ATP-dependent exoDNAse (exonuclease V) beta subunit